MSTPTGNEITRVLADLHGRDDETVLGGLIPLVYDELRFLASAQLHQERPDHTLQPTALVHEAYLRMLGGQSIPWANRSHFFRAAAEAMRRILIEHARKRGRVKRGGGRPRLPMNVLDLAAEQDSTEILALDEAIRRLEEQDARMSQVVRLRFFAGLSVEDTAMALEVSERTVKREWTFARAWLYRALCADQA